MVAYRKTTYFYIIWFCHILGPECFSDGSYSYDTRHLSVKSGGSVTIPCYYDRKYTQQMKFWYSEYDNIRIYTNTTAGDVTVIDDPAQSLFTVTMRNLKGRHNGTYYCAVETGEQPGDMITTDDLYLHVQPAPDVSVMSSSVTVDEGGNISVKCLYSNKYKNEHKQWCRYKDKSCYTSQNASVKISDDGRGSLTVVMSGLMKSDSGWYYCSVNVQQPPVQDLLVPVQITVKAAATPDNSTESKCEPSQFYLLGNRIKRIRISGLHILLPIGTPLLSLQFFGGDAEGFILTKATSTGQQPESLAMERPESPAVKWPENLTKKSEAIFVLNLVLLSSRLSPTSLAPTISTAFTTIFSPLFFPTSTAML